MPTIQYKFGGQTFKSKVTNAFLQRPKDQQNSILKSQLMAKYEDRIAPHTGERGFLDYLAALEKPAQALKVGLKESALGGDLFRAAGGVDLTPEEGFWEGASRGWSGEEEVRTQDFLPDDMNPILKGVLGFAGDVATDPLTYVGAGVIRGIGSTIARATPRSVAKKLTAAKNTMFDKELPIGDGVGMKDLARWFNAPVGKGRQVKGIYGTAQNHLRRMEKEMAEELPKLNKFFQARATTLGVSASHVHRAFRDTMERGTGTSISLQYQRDLGKEGEKLLKQWEDRTNEWHELEQAFGLKYDPIKEKGYFPRLLTRPGGNRHRARTDHRLWQDAGSLRPDPLRPGAREYPGHRLRRLRLGLVPLRLRQLRVAPRRRGQLRRHPQRLGRGLPRRVAATRRHSP